MTRPGPFRLNFYAFINSMGIQDIEVIEPGLQPVISPNLYRTLIADFCYVWQEI